MLRRFVLTLVLVLSWITLIGCDEKPLPDPDMGSASISGIITQDGIGIEGIEVELSGDDQKTTSTNSDGNYSFDHLEFGTYTVTPSNELGESSPESIEVITDENEVNVTGVDFEFDVSDADPNPGCAEAVWNGDFVALSGIGVALLTGVTEITGNLTISGTSWVNLEFLKCLQYVGGHLTISGNALVNLKGLENLTEVGGSLTIVGNALVDFTGLDNLEYVGGHVTISATTALSLKGFENLETIDGTLNLTGNGVLLNIEALSSLTSVEDIIFVANPVIKSLEGFNGITSTGSIIISDNPNITSLKGLKNLKTVDSYFTIKKNAKLTSLDLSGLESVNYDFAVKYNPSLCTGLAEALADEISVDGETIIIGNKICP